MSFQTIRSPKEKEKGKGKPGRAPEPPRAKKRRWIHFPWKCILLAAIPVGLAAYYLTQVAPGIVPLPPDMVVPFPALTDAMEGICAACGRNPETVYAVAAGLLLAGCFIRYADVRYYVMLAVVVSLGLALTWYSISAPMDRLLKSVEDNLPRDHRVPGSSVK